MHYARVSAIKLFCLLDILCRIIFTFKHNERNGTSPHLDHAWITLVRNRKSIYCTGSSLNFGVRILEIKSRWTRKLLILNGYLRGMYDL